MNRPPPSVLVSGSFDDIRSHQVRFLEEAAKLGRLTALVLPDEFVRKQTGQPPKFPLAERLYFLNAIRHVFSGVAAGGLEDRQVLSLVEDGGPWIWVDEETSGNSVHIKFCERHGIQYRVLPAAQMEGFPEPASAAANPAGRKVVVTGCYDWFHTGHVRFFEEASAYGDLYVIVGHDENLRLLKGEGHPMFPARERRYLCASIKHVKEALISSGEGWLDADPEIRRLKPDVYVVNEDGDQGGKRDYCHKLGIEYVVLQRRPAPGLQGRTSTDLRRAYLQSNQHDTTDNDPCKLEDGPDPERYLRRDARSGLVGGG